MEKEKKIIYKFLAFILVGLSIVIYGITHKVIPNVLAETINIGYVTNKTTILYENNNAAAMVSIPVNNTINQYLYDILVIQLDNQTISKDYTYMLELYLPEAKLKNINNIYVVGGDNNSTTCQTIGLDNSNNSYPKIYFKCPTNLTHLTIGLNNDSPATSTESITTTNNFRWSYAYLRYYTEDDDIDLGPVISNATNNTNNIINNQNNNTKDIIKNQNELLGTKCENLWNSTLQVGPYAYSDGLHYNFNTYYSNATPISVTPGNYYISYTTGANRGDNGALFYNNGQFLGYQMISTDGVINVPDGANQLNFNFASLNGTYQPTNIMLTKGSTPNVYCEYGTYISKLDEQTKTSKGILGKIGDLISYINPASENFFVYKLIELLGNLLKDLFVPSQSYLNNWYNDFKDWIELKLGFLATPITLFLDFIELYLNLDEGQLVINIPEIKVPNFEEQVLIQARTFDWGELLNSKTEFKNLWELYLDFIDVFLILNFLGLCENTYNRIFGGDTTQYEYYTTEETYNINDETGEATNHQLRQRRTRRERV